MAKPFRPKRGTTAQNDAFTGLEHEITLDKEKKSLRVHDGVTAGGADEILPKSKTDEIYATKGELSTLDQTVEQEKTDIRALIAEELAKYLPLVGGVMSGKVTTSALRGMDSTNSDGFFFVSDADVSSILTGSLGLFPIDHSVDSRKGGFELVASDGTNCKRLVGSYENGLTWSGIQIEQVKSSGESWIRYESGLQICWGAYQVSSGTQVSEVVFPVPFLSKSSYVPNANSLTKGNINLICTRDANGANGEKMTVQAYQNGATSAPTTSYWVAWSARGKWKEIE